jgi:prophage regulatory protein
MDKILRLPAVKAATGRSRSSIYQGVADGTFPGPVGIGARAVGWRESEIENWLQSLQSKRGGQSKLPRVKAGGRSLIAKADLVGFLEASTDGPTKESTPEQL